MVQNIFLEKLEIQKCVRNQAKAINERFGKMSTFLGLAKIAKSYF